MFWLPYIAQYRYRLPLVSLQDAHGTESWWWSNELVNHRTLFIAREPSYEAMITSLKNNWIAAVRHDSVSSNVTRMLGGTTAARKFITNRKEDWQWWDFEEKPMRPWGAITVIRPEDKFEVGRPDTGLVIRVRCWWNSVRQSLRTPVVELTKLEVDGQVVEASLVNRKARNGVVSDSYYQYPIRDLQKGNHVIKATFKKIADGSMKTITTSFDQN
jgi:hypothetical protein